jgi:hypothetical protein
MKVKKYAIVYILSRKGSGGLSLAVRSSSHLLLLGEAKGDRLL